MTTTNKKSSFLMYYEYQTFFESLTYEQAGMLIIAIFRHEIQGECVELPSNVYPIYKFICDMLDKNKEKYQKQCEKNRENINKRWNKGNDDNSFNNL